MRLGLPPVCFVSRYTFPGTGTPETRTLCQRRFILQQYSCSKWLSVCVCACEQLWTRQLSAAHLAMYIGMPLDVDARSALTSAIRALVQPTCRF